MSRLLSVLPLILLLASCTDTTNTVYVHDQGTYRGKVRQYGIDGKLASDQAGASVSILGTNFKVLTESDGNFTIENVPAGIYNLLITKPGFDTAFIPSDQFNGAGTQFLMNPQIQKIPYDSLVILSAGFYPDTVVKYTKDVYVLDSIIVNGSDTDRRGHTESRVLTDTGYSLKLTIGIVGPDSLAPTNFRIWYNYPYLDSLRAAEQITNVTDDSTNYAATVIPKDRPFSTTLWTSLFPQRAGIRRGDILTLRAYGTVERRADKSYPFWGWLPKCPSTSSVSIVFP